MQKINWSRVFIGGLVAGLVINISESLLNGLIIGADWEAAYTAIGLPAQETTGMIVWYLASGFILGIAAVGIYAGFRPRCGAGPATALWSGATVWFLTYFMGYGSVFFAGLFPMHLFWWTELWGIMEILVAALIGAWLYHE